MRSEKSQLTTPEHSVPGRLALALVLVPIAALLVASWIADALWPALLRDHPLLLIALSARNRYLTLVASKVDPLPFFAIAAARLTAGDPLFYLLGRWWGNRAVEWIERRYGSSRNVWRRVEGAFSRVGPAVVFVAPNNLVCAVAGSARMRPAVFLGFNLAGTATRLALIYWLGNALAHYLEEIRDFVGEHVSWILPLTIASVALVVVRDLRRTSEELREKQSLTSVQRAENTIPDVDEVVSAGEEHGREATAD